MGVPVRLSPTCSSSFSCLPLPWLLPAPSLRRALRPLRLLPMSTMPLAMLPSMIPLQLSPMSTMLPVMLLTLLPLQLRLTSMTSPALLQHLPSPTPATLTPTAPTPTSPLVPTSLLPPPPMPPTPTPMLDTLDTPTPLLPTTPAVSTTLAALCLAPKRPAFKLRPKDRRRTAKDRGRLENENWILEDVV